MDLPAGQRAGVFTLAGVMARHSHPDQSLAGGPRRAGLRPPAVHATRRDPPDDVDAVVPKPDPNVPTRVRFEQHRVDPKCAGCHALMDPLGIPFEIYDGIGKLPHHRRPAAGGRHQRAEGHRQRRPGEGRDRADGAGWPSTSQVRRCMTQQWFRYAFGRMDTDGDKPAIDAALGAFDGAGNKIPELMVALTTTNAFRFRRTLDLP